MAAGTTPGRENPQLWTPGIKLGVRPGSFFHLTECFGPVLGLMRAEDLDEAIERANAPPFGLTSGIQTLDDREVARWVDRIEAGNLYVNRHITGAIVRRQPFGGWKASSVGPGSQGGRTQLRAPARALAREGQARSRGRAAPGASGGSSRAMPSRAGRVRRARSRAGQRRELRARVAPTLQPRARPERRSRRGQRVSLPSLSHG